jgi:putative Mg2+ transporter-C (MgtC) family protein
MGPELALDDAVWRILLVAVLAGAVGIERELSDQEAGLRTHTLVGVGAALFVIVGNYAWGDLNFGNQAGVVLDPSRVVAYVVTGVGFLGAGAILKNGGSIRGLTTAASLWVVAAIGVAGGAGEYALAVFTTAVVLVSLWPLKELARWLGLRRRGTRRFEIELEPGTSVGEIVAFLEREGVELQSTKVEEVADARQLEIVLAARTEVAADALDHVASAPGVRSATLAQ